MNALEQLTSRLRDPVAFAEEYCEWYSGDYCLYPEGSIYDAAIEAIEEWALESEDNYSRLERAAYE